MKKEIIKTLTKDFETHANKTTNDIEFWFARDLQHLLSYTNWDNFIKVIITVKTACETAGHEAAGHFSDVGKIFSIGSGTEHKVIEPARKGFAISGGRENLNNSAFIFPAASNVKSNNNSGRFLYS